MGENERIGLDFKDGPGCEREWLET